MVVMIGSRDVEEDVEARSTGKRKKRWKKGRWGKGASKGTLSIAEVVLTMEG